MTVTGVYNQTLGIQATEESDLNYTDLYDILCMDLFSKKNNLCMPMPMPSSHCDI